jgi:TPR repeat protein/membrane associated rhomboid family serine protease
MTLRARMEVAVKKLQSILFPELSESFLRQLGSGPAAMTMRSLSSTSKTMSASARSFLIRFSDRSVGFRWGQRLSSFHFTGKGQIIFDSDTVRFIGKRGRPFWFSSTAELTVKLSSVMNVQRSGRSVRLEISDEDAGASIFVKRKDKPFITLWAEDEARAAAIDAQLPRRKSEIFIQKMDFEARLEHATPNVYVTPTLVAINVLVFVAMLPAGAGFLVPNGQVHVQWGSNFGPLTTDGQWWRLFTCMFLHFGVIHLALNMWALYENGRVAERLYGNFYFLVLYLFAGLAGSLASVLWNPVVNSAGASGAIFGVLGGLLAFTIVKRNRVPPSVMKAQRNSTLAFILYSLVYGFSHQGIDNAAHVGGLAGGFLVGLLLARPLEPERRKAGGVRLVSSIAAMALAVGLLATPLQRVLKAVTTYTAAGTSHGDDQSVAQLREAARQGNAVAQYNLGVRYRDGVGLPQDYKEAVDWFRKAAEQGFALAQSNLGNLYASGRGVPGDAQEAVRWLRKGAEQGLAAAQFNLGLMYLDGHGVPQDDQQAVAWFSKAAEQGFASAENSLGVLYEQGRGVAHDDQRAVEWYRKAAEQNNANAQNTLGGMYANGRGVPRDRVLAYMLFSLAALNANERAAHNKVSIEQGLSQSEIQEGRALATMWKPGMPLPTHSQTGTQLVPAKP